MKDRGCESVSSASVHVHTTHCYSPDKDDEHKEDNCSEGDRQDKEDGSKYSAQDGGSPHARQRFIWLIH